jgi:hypothetical protein
LRKIIISVLEKLLFWIGKPEFKKSSGDEGVVFLGRNANSILKNPAIDYVFKKIEADLLKAFQESAPKDKEKRENVYYRMEGVAFVKVKLLNMVNNMILEEKAINSRK